MCLLIFHYEELTKGLKKAKKMTIKEEKKRERERGGKGHR